MMLAKLAYLKLAEWVFLLLVAVAMNQFGSLLFETRKSTLVEVLGVSIVAFFLLNLLGLFLLSSSIVTWWSDKYELNRIVFSALLSIAMLASIYLMFVIGSQGDAFRFGVDHQLFVITSIAYGIWTFIVLLAWEWFKQI